MDMYKIYSDFHVVVYLSLKHVVSILVAVAMFLLKVLRVLRRLFSLKYH